jgi:hypothetical protein
MKTDKLELEIKNIEYWKSFYIFFKRLFSFFNKMPSERIPKKEDFSLKIDDEETLIYKSILTINFKSLIQDNIKTIIKWPEYLKLSNNAIFLSAIGTVFEDKHNIYLNNNYLGAITRILYKKSNYSFKLKEKSAFDQYRFIENYIYSDDLSLVVKAPIFNLEINQKVIKIEDKIYLKKIEDADLGLFNPFFPHFSLGVSPVLLSCKAVIETEEKVNKDQAYTVGIDTIHSINKVISSLCVFKRNRIAIGPFFSKPKNFWSIFAGIHSSSMPNETYIHYNKSILEIKDIRLFRIFWKKYNNSAKENPWLDLAERRLLRMFYKMRIEDQFIDIMTIFEILFLPEGAGELKYRLSVRGAILLGKSYEEKYFIHKVFKISYDIRSSIVHTGFVSKKDNKQLDKLRMNLTELYEKLQYYLFKSIEIFTKNPEVRNNFDDIIFR